MAAAACRGSAPRRLRTITRAARPRRAAGPSGTGPLATVLVEALLRVEARKQDKGTP